MKMYSKIAVRQLTRICGPNVLRALMAIAVLLQFAPDQALAADNLDNVITLNIPANTRLEDALIEWGTKAGVTVMINTTTVDGQLTGGLRGTLRARAALGLLLKESGLSYTVEGQRIRIVASASLLNSGLRPMGSRRESEPAVDKDTSANTVDTQTADMTTDAKPGHRIDEVIVTAQKREERLQDVPIPVAVLDTQNLAATNQTTLSSYFNQVPNFTIAPNIASRTSLSIRGISLGGLSSNRVGILIDDVPFGNGQLVPDIDPGILSQVEVLRGPEGSLYGASSMGGLLKYVTLDPTMNHVSGRVEAGTADVKNGYSWGYSARGSINVPVSDQLAFRASALMKQDPGYLNNPLTQVNGLNESRAAGGQLSVLWKPLESLSVKLQGIYQDLRGDGSNDITSFDWNGNPVTCDLCQGYIKNVGQWQHKTQFYSAVVNGKLGNLSLTSVTGYTILNTLDSFDSTSGGVGEAEVLPVFGVIGAPVFDVGSERKFTQEFRLSEQFGPQFEGALGVFYSHDSTPHGEQTILGTDPLTGAVAGVGYYSTASGEALSQEHAVFANFTYRPTDRFSLQIGGRDSWYSSILYATTFDGPFVNFQFGQPPPFVLPTTYTSSPAAVTYLFTPEFKITPDAMVYIRLASGFTPGGTNYPGPNIPRVFQPEKTLNYEIGSKASFWDHKASIDISAYYIDWKDIQLLLSNATGSIYYTGNGGRAKSQGIELSGEITPIRNLTVSGWVVISDAHLVDFPVEAREGGTYAFPGDQLPNSSRISGNLSIRKSFLLKNQITGFLEADGSYLGDRKGVFLHAAYPTPPDIPRQNLPGYAKVDLRAALEYESWTASLYVNNVADKRGVLSGGGGEVFPQSYFLIPPRTFGLTLLKTF